LILGAQPIEYLPCSPQSEKMHLPRHVELKWNQAVAAIRAEMTSALSARADCRAEIAEIRETVDYEQTVGKRS
jgi:hypothetical protein